MTISKLIENEVPWERTSDGRPARHVALPRVNRAGAYLRALAHAKLKDARAVSAEFSGEPGYFERRICILREEASSMRIVDFFVANDVTGTMPSVCIRTAGWEREIDYRSFEAAPSKRDYALSSGQVESRIRFYSIDREAVLRLLRDTEIRLRQGVVIPDASTSNSCTTFEANFDRLNVSFWFSNDSNCGLDSLIREFELEIGKFAHGPEIPSDNGCRISYESSVWERIESFSR